MDQKTGVTFGTNAAPGDPADVLDDLLARATRAGADAADAVFVDRRALSVAFRLGQRETLESSDARLVGLRVFRGRRQALVSSSDVSVDGRAALVERALAMAATVPEDPYCGLAQPSEIVDTVPDLDCCEAVQLDAAVIGERARTAEAAALAVPGVTNSDGSEAESGTDRFAIAATNGLRQVHARSWHSVSVSVLAGSGTAMERDYEYASAVYAPDLDDPATLGRRCGERTVRRLKPQKVASAQMPVVFEPRVARSLLGHLSAAINGTSVARGTTFLARAMGTQVFPPDVTIIDDPLRPRGLRSRPFDAEGIPAQRRAIVDRGVLTSWLLDLRSARQLQLPTTGHAARGAGSLPSPAPSNLYLQAGRQSVEELLADIRAGLYVTDLMGFGVNGVTGDYSRGASGFFIENGRLAYPVSEITVSGNLLQMFRSIRAADDLVFRYGMDSPTVRVDDMTVAGR